MVALVLFGTGTAAASARVPDTWRTLRPGLVVETEGELKNERFVAKEIDIRTTEASSKVEIIAPLEAVDANAASIAVLGFSLTLPTDCKVRDELDAPVSLADLSSGDWVEIDGVIEGPETIRARRVRLLSEERTTIQIEGAITGAEVERRRLEVAGFPVRLDRSAVVRGGTLLEKAPRAVHVPRAVDDDDRRPAIWRGFGDRVRGGGSLEAEVTPEDNFDLNSRRLGDLTTSTWSAELQLDARFSSLEAFVKTGVREERIHTDEEGDESDNSQWRLQQAYALWRPASLPMLALQIGRQDFDEKREWLYDENLDGVRLHAQLGRVRTEASVSTRWNTSSKRLADWTNWILVAETEVKRSWFTTSYVLHRRLRGDTGNQPVWFGLRSRGRIASGIKHWAELSLLRGRSERADLDAYAIDVGARLRLHRRSRLAVTVGYALGSGGPEPGDRFRQTGLQDNNNKFGGVSSFKYYGELLEPELSNLEIATGGVGFRPSRESSIDLVLHRYWQPHAASKLHGTNLESRTRGRDTDVGNEWNLILAFEEISGVNVEYVFAKFNPGDAFDPIATSARFHKLSVEFNF
jgi:alginate production protein